MFNHPTNNRTDRTANYALAFKDEGDKNLVSVNIDCTA